MWAEAPQTLECAGPGDARQRVNKLWERSTEMLKNQSLDTARVQVFTKGDRSNLLYRNCGETALAYGVINGRPCRQGIHCTYCRRASREGQLPLARTEERKNRKRLRRAG